ncbi:hypothetical protein L0222_20055, partial [bacterium]|nr:hypothetical protein [bacterium]
ASYHALIVLNRDYRMMQTFTTMTQAPAVDEALGSNLLGAMVGGCLEYAAMAVGYKALTLSIPVIYLFAVVLYGVIGERPTITQLQLCRDP